MPRRRRAPNACRGCRDRKIKCDVSSSGTPCQNCARTNAECLVVGRKRSMTKHAYRPGLPLESMHIFEVDTVQSTNNQGAGKEITTNLDECWTSDICPLPPTGRSPTDLLPIHEEISPECHLPSYIIPLRPDLDPGVLCLLRQKKALSLPRQAVMGELLRVYICYVHPFLPLLDLGYFLDAVEGKNGSKKVSLILFQAVMFAATSFIDIRHLKTEGFERRKEARKYFFDRVRLLFDSDVELDPSTLVQALLLMTYWYDKPADTKGRTYWMRIALSFANDLGLGQNSELAMSSPHEQMLRRRLWWCCLMRDRLISLSELRPSSISTDETSFPVLSANDFECQTFAEALKKYSGQSNDEQWQALTELCFQKVKLCILIGRILHTLYKPRRVQHIASTEPTVTLLPDLSDSATAEFVARDQELRKWSSDMCPTMHCLVNEDLWRNCSTVSVHCSSLEMLYYTVLGIVHRPRLLTHSQPDSAAGAIQDLSRKVVREGAQRITQIAKVFKEADLLRFLPPIGVTALLASAVQHAKDTVSSAPPICKTAQLSLKQTTDSLAQLQQIYFSADHAMAFIELIGSKQNLDDSRDLREMTVFPLFRNELLNYHTPQTQNMGERASSVTENPAECFDTHSDLFSACELMTPWMPL